MPQNKTYLPQIGASNVVLSALERAEAEAACQMLSSSHWTLGVMYAYQPVPLTSRILRNLQQDSASMTILSTFLESSGIWH